MAAVKLMFSNLLTRSNGLRLLANTGCSCTRNLIYRGISTKNFFLLENISSNKYTTSLQQQLKIPWLLCTRFFASKTSKRTTVKKKNDVLKPNLKLGPDVLYHELPIIFVNATYNNTMFTITDHNGRTAAWTSAGEVGFKGAKRGTNHAAQTAGESACKKAASLGINRVRVKVRGMGPGRQTSVKGLIAGGVEIVSITDVTPIPHNGCRPPKQRRI